MPEEATALFGPVLEALKSAGPALGAIAGPLNLIQALAGFVGGGGGGGGAPSQPPAMRAMAGSKGPSPEELASRGVFTPGTFGASPQFMEMLGQLSPPRRGTTGAAWPSPNDPEMAALDTVESRLQTPGSSWG